MIDESLIDTLPYMARKATINEKPCRILVEEMGIRINMWLRTDDGLFADRNHMFGWTELKYIDNGIIDTVFYSLNFYIEQRIKTLRKQREAQNPNPPLTENELGRIMKNMHDFERKTRGD